ncbi:MAG: hypoxanthine phosphoribosyltransferase [Syntrophobacteraceae bacterium]
MKKYRLVERISTERLGDHVDELASRINHDYEGKSLVLIGVLKGAFIFMADLARRLSSPVQMDFVRLASYGDQTETCGSVRITKDIELAVRGRHVIVVEDIVDTGITLKWFLEHLKSHCPESVRVCALIDKLERREVEVPLDYVGITLDSGFLVGYGLDFSENHRNLPAIHEVVFEDAEALKD